MLDPRINAMRDILYSGITPLSITEAFGFCKMMQNDSFLDINILWRGI